MTTQAVPATDTIGGTPELTAYFARALLALVGPAWQAPPRSVNEADFLTLGEALARVFETVERAVAQSHPGTATDLLAELEAEYGLEGGALLDTPTRQRRLLVAFRARGWPAPTAVVATARAMAAEAVLVATTWPEVEGTDPSAVFRFALLLSYAHVTDAFLVAELERALARQVGADESWSIGRTRRRFRCAFRGTVTPTPDGVGDDSRCDIDLLAV